MEYKVITINFDPDRERDESALAEEVNKALADGWELHGPLNVTPETVSFNPVLRQVMVRKDRSETVEVPKDFVHAVRAVIPDLLHYATMQHAYSEAAKRVADIRAHLLGKG